MKWETEHAEVDLFIDELSRLWASNDPQSSIEWYDSVFWIRQITSVIQLKGLTSIVGECLIDLRDFLDIGDETGLYANVWMDLTEFIPIVFKKTNQSQTNKLLIKTDKFCN